MFADDLVQPCSLIGRNYFNEADSSNQRCGDRDYGFRHRLGRVWFPSSSNSAASKTSTTSTTTTTSKPQSKVAPRTTVPGPNPTIAGYIQQSGIADARVHRGDPGAPTINLPVPDGWADAGSDTPATAYGPSSTTAPRLLITHPASWRRYPSSSAM
jgi:Probable lipoprotein LpqN